MSRNKDIKILHNLTGWSFKKCRAHMKAYNWDLVKALPFCEVLDSISEIINNTMTVMGEAINLFATTAQDFASQLTQAMNESISKIDSK